MRERISIVLLLAFAVASAVYACTPTAIRWARKSKWLDVPGGRKSHRRAVPQVGGIVIYGLWATSMLIYAFIRPDWWSNVGGGIFSLLAAIGILVTGGAIDDRKRLSPKIKFIFQVIAALVVLAFHAGVRTAIAHLSFELGFIAWPLAFLWLVGMSNAINLVDGLDGLATTISICILGSLIGLGLATGNGVEFQVGSALLAAALTGFLFYNLPPARSFLGDAGSLPTGFAIGVFVLETSSVAPSGTERFVTLALLAGYPILDTMLVVYHRLRNGVSIFAGDQNHIHHRLVRLGLQRKEALTVIVLVSVFIQLHAVIVSILLSDDSIRSNASHWGLLVLATVTLAASLCVGFLFLRKFERKASSSASGESRLEADPLNIIAFPRPIPQPSGAWVARENSEVSNVRDRDALGSPENHIRDGST